MSVKVKTNESITFPIFIVIFSRIIFKTSISRNKSSGIIIVFFGAFFLISKGDFPSLLALSFAIGDVWMLIAAILFANYKKQRSREMGIDIG
ncbi:MAG: hypothetical protein H8D65_01545 [Spirochaetes bacterium]|nr:hypothetical protein [Spirochaetota bacterium]